MGGAPLTPSSSKDRRYRRHGDVERVALLRTLAALPPRERSGTKALSLEFRHRSSVRNMGVGCAVLGFGVSLATVCIWLRGN